MKNDYPEFRLGADDWLEDQFYCQGDYMWDVKELWQAAKQEPTYDVPLISIYAGHPSDDGIWDRAGEDLMVFAKHCQLVHRAQLKYPIILDPYGAIADGRHRLIKAMITGKTTIRAKRLSGMPQPAYVMKDGEPVPYSV